MTSKKGYKENKHRPEYKNWWKRYFAKRTCRKIKKERDGSRKD